LGGGDGLETIGLCVVVYIMMIPLSESRTNGGRTEALLELMDTGIHFL
jgi:hypothetical protein